jgi:hypothetical protein
MMELGWNLVLLVCLAIKFLIITMPTCAKHHVVPSVEGGNNAGQSRERQAGCVVECYVEWPMGENGRESSERGYGVE